VNAGLHVISPKLIEMVRDKQKDKPKIDLDRDLLKPLCGTGQMYCYDSPEYVKDMGTPERFHQVEADYRNGVVQAKNLGNKQSAIFLDRDGTINKYVGFLRNIDEFELLPGAAEAIKLINQSGYLAIVVTNQPVIARGEVSWEELHEIHRKMQTLLGKEGAYLDGIYICPHHPDKGFNGERPEYKFDCDCRKPKPGLLLQAAQDFNIDLSQSIMIGDSERDVEAGKNAGCKESYLIGTNEDNALFNIVSCICK
jgi:D-glycero-D-manno-heptose 1,7-bisphosphate phosphatase